MCYITPILDQELRTENTENLKSQKASQVENLAEAMIIVLFFQRKTCILKLLFWRTINPCTSKCKLSWTLKVFNSILKCTMPVLLVCTGVTFLQPVVRTATECMQNVVLVLFCAS